MAVYSTLQEAIDAGITNMTVLRNNVANDDLTITYPTGITWLYFNNIQVTNIYSSGNSWLGFGSAVENLRVNRRDAKVYYEYIETGSIGGVQFLKFRWCGYSYYGSVNDSYKQEWDIFLFNNGKIFLNFYSVPTSMADGQNQLVCGTTTTSYSVTTGIPCEYTFTASDKIGGTGWSVASGRPSLLFKTNGQADISLITFSGTVIESLITWDEVVPDGTAVTVKRSLNGSGYTDVSNGGELVPNGSYPDHEIFLRINLSTTDPSLSPLISNIYVSVKTIEDNNIILLNTERFRNVYGDVTVTYGGGNLMGEGGPVASFSGAFTPIGLIPKPNQNDEEHVALTAIGATGEFKEVFYMNAKLDENLALIAISAIGSRMHIDDI